MAAATGSATAPGLLTIPEKMKAEANRRRHAIGGVAAPEVTPGFRWQPQLPRAKNSGLNSLVSRLTTYKGAHNKQHASAGRQTQATGARQNGRQSTQCQC